MKPQGFIWLEKINKKHQFYGCFNHFCFQRASTDINLPGAVDWVMMQSCFDHNFMLVLEKQEHEGRQMFYAIVQLIGTRRQAEGFAYRLELNGQRRRLTWEATPRSIHDGVQQAIQVSDCMVFDSNCAQMFSENGNLGINVTISMCSP